MYAVKTPYRDGYTTSCFAAFRCARVQNAVNGFVNIAAVVIRVVFGAGGAVSFRDTLPWNFVLNSDVRVSENRLYSRRTLCVTDFRELSPRSFVHMA